MILKWNRVIEESNILNYLEDREKVKLSRGIFTVLHIVDKKGVHVTKITNIAFGLRN